MANPFATWLRMDNRLIVQVVAPHRQATCDNNLERCTVPDRWQCISWWFLADRNSEAAPDVSSPASEPSRSGSIEACVRGADQNSDLFRSSTTVRSVLNVKLCCSRLTFWNAVPILTGNPENGDDHHRPSGVAPLLPARIWRSRQTAPGQRSEDRQIMGRSRQGMWDRATVSTSSGLKWSTSTSRTVQSQNSQMLAASNALLSRMHVTTHQLVESTASGRALNPETSTPVFRS